MKLPQWLMDISAYSMQGRRSHMEDYFDIGYQMKPPDQRHPNEWPFEYFYFGIFDGHGGSEASQFAKHNLLKFIVRQPDFWSSQDEDVLRAIRQGYADTHSAMRELLSTWSRTNKTLPSTAGTTASVLFIRNGKFYTGHVGDSRIVISRKHPETQQWISQQLTEDHKPESQSEIERIERAGGDVKAKLGVHRVVWRRPVFTKEFDDKLRAEPRTEEYDDCMRQIETYPVEESVVEEYQNIPFLSIARSLGDFWSINPLSGQFIVSPEPDVMCRPIDENDECILLATDGLWNVMNSSLAIRFLQELKVVKEGNRDGKQYSEDYFATDNFYDISLPDNDKNHAVSLVYLAYQIWERRRLRSDNITAVVAMLSDILPSTQVKTSERRSSRQHSKESYKFTLTDQYIDDNTIQLGQTHIFSERISIDSKPKFYAHPCSNDERKFLAKLGEYLIFPPTIFDCAKAGVIEPRNFERLYQAQYKILLYFNMYKDDYDHVYVKNVSDDPADDKKEPSRLNKKNKKVRDSSCQASQPLHDFCLPWDQLTDSDEENEVGYRGRDSEESDEEERIELYRRSRKSDRKRLTYEPISDLHLNCGELVRADDVEDDEEYIEKNKLDTKLDNKRKRRSRSGDELNIIVPKPKSTRCS